MPKIILLGDPTDHGGKVTGSSAPRFTVGGKPVALKGAPAAAPNMATMIASLPKAILTTPTTARPWPMKATSPAAVRA